MSSSTQVNQITLALRWLDGSSFISESNINLTTQAYANMDLAALTATAPTNANQVQAVLRLGSVDAGDDVEWSILGPQLEAGVYPTTRTNGLRLQDEITIPEYNAADQKIRFEMIAGFNSGGADLLLAAGPINVYFLATGELQVEVPEVNEFIATPLTFNSGDLIDITIEHQSGKNLAVYRDGQLLADATLPVFTATPGPLTLFGVGVELLKLSVFSR